MSTTKNAAKKPTYRQLCNLISKSQEDIGLKNIRIQELEQRLESLKAEENVKITNLEKTVQAVGAARDDWREKYYGIIRERNDWESKAKLFEKQFFQLSANSRSMLMSMVYSLNMVTSASTHHEKEVVIRHMKTCFGHLAQKEIGLALEPTDDFPF